MTLSDAQAKELIVSPKNKLQIDEVRKQESSLRVFTEEMSETELHKEPYFAHFLRHMEKRIEKKFTRLTQFFRFPLPVVAITDAILNDFYKVFEGKNRFFAVNSADDITDLREWLVINDPETWVEMEGREVFRNKPSNIVVVDRDENGTPYLISVGLNRLVDAYVKHDTGQLGYVVFRHSYKTARRRMEGGEMENVKIELFSVYDEERYRVFEYNTGSGGMRKIVDNEHNLGYCPAHLFVKTPANSHNWMKRRTPFGQSISKLEDWTTFDVFRNYTDYYAPFPVTESPISKCANPNCKDGKVGDEQVIDHDTGERRIVWTDCSVCDGGKKKLNLIGPGTHIGIKVQKDRQAEDGSGKFAMYFPDTDKMKYIPEKLDDIEIEVRYKTVGISSLLDDQAVNEIQARGSFAGMDNILLRTKEELDYIYDWIVATVAKLYYPDSEVSIEANFGTEWYLITEEQLQKRFEEAKRIGLPKYEQAAIFDQLIETKYKGNSTKIMRQKLLFLLEPLPLYTEAEAVELFEKGAITREELNLKLNFYNFIQRFEGEQANVTEFGSSLQMDQRLVRIMEILERYNEENLARFPAVVPTGGGDE